MEDQQKPVEDAPVIRIANTTILQGIVNHADQIEIQPTEWDTRVLLQTGSETSEYMALPDYIHEPLIQRFKDLACKGHDDPSHKGQIPVRYDGKDYVVQASFASTPYGESVRLWFSKQDGHR